MESSRRSSAAESTPAQVGARITSDQVSVILCTRDRAEMLDRALGALCAALADSAEIIVVDSGSTTIDTARTAERHSVRYVRSDIPGLSIARNLGLETSEREIVVFTDDDCLVAEGFLDPLIEPFSSPAVGATTGHLRDISDTSERDPNPPTAILTDVLDGLDAGHGALMAFRRSVITDLGGFDPVLGAGRHFGGAEDTDALCRVLDAGLHIARVQAAEVQHVFTRDDADYRRLARAYGLGTGAMCSKWRRSSRTNGRRLTVRIARRAASRYARRMRTTRSRRGQAAYIGGLVKGMREARHVPVTGTVFTDVQPPEPVVLGAAAPRPASEVST